MLLNELPSLGDRNLSQTARNRIRRNVPIPQQQSKRWYVISALAAGLAFVAFQLFAGRRQLSAPQLATSTVHAVPMNLEISKLAPPPDAKSELVYRGAASSTDPDAAELAPAFAAYNQENYLLAAARFGQLAKHFPGSDIPLLYLGVSQLLSGDNSAALESLAQADAIAKPARKDAASWYHAAAAVRGHSPDAPALLQTLCSRGSSTYAEQACSTSTRLGENTIQ
jgi:hypothetical protein